MKYSRVQFTKSYYQLWELGLLLPVPTCASEYTVKYRKNEIDEYSQVTLKAGSVSDALERACYAITYASPWRPEDIDLHAVYDTEENLLWVDEPFYDFVQKRNEFRGMDRREFLTKFGLTSAAVLFGMRFPLAQAGTVAVSLGGSASGFVGEQIYSTPGSYTWTVPAGVTSVSVVCIGAGGGGWNGQNVNSRGGGGGGLGYRNNISVVAGSSIAVVVGQGAGSGGKGADTYFKDTATVVGYGGSGDLAGLGSRTVGGGYIGDGGGNGGNGGQSYSYGGGGGAGGYSGKGGDGGASGGNGVGGGGGGANDAAANAIYGYGGGVGLFGQGANGSGGSNGAGGSGGTNGGTSVQYGGAYGGGAFGGAGQGGNGAVRIIWGAGRSFPNSAT